MKAFCVTSFESPPDFMEIERPAPDKNEVLLRIGACGLNFADLLMLEGKYQETPTPPFVPGLEVAGTVVAVGENVDPALEGKRVAVFGGSGGLAEYGAFPADRCIPLPDQMTMAEAAGFQVAYGTSHVALDHKAKLQLGETLLVLGAAGGVGLTAVEIGKRMGATVIACARGANKLAVAKAAGADHVIDSETEDLRGELKALGGVDVIYDAVGGELCETAFRACKPEARILIIGFASGRPPVIKPNHLLVKNVSMLGLYWGGYLKFRPQVLTDSMAQLFDWYKDGGLKPPIGHILPFDETPEALDMLKTRRSTGKVVIQLP
ncbi:NADPH:quinone oxidoreductase family protein [Actibacterium pelagium]|uniref:NADPH:quinone oxidoreductase n=1 Tax=Actibacterium pelagium TaxID=2029103 RepID=A0A917AE73_9RHOB|nr:NADPH:quinone oxidoreductase family protein [Actibacterium pelagium]GGE43898.1 NADPH:quinone oxidoreductase [Actibacterium pelagium]